MWELIDVQINTFKMLTFIYVKKDKSVYEETF